MLSALFYHFAACTTTSFFVIPPWYKYFKLDIRGNCKPIIQLVDSSDTLQLDSLLLLGLGILDILLRVAAMIAVGVIIYAGVQFITAQGEPEKAKKALGTIIDALVGLGITIVAAATVSFVGHRVGL